MPIARRLSSRPSTRPSTPSQHLLQPEVDTEKPLWSKTPLLRSEKMSDRLGCDVYLKLENLQPPLSFKYRGISLFAQRALDGHGPNVHLISASSGNTGLALAYSCKRLGIKCTIFLPEGACRIVPLPEREGAKVVVGGKEYVDALGAARKALENEKHAVMIPSYDDPIIWEGHVSMVHEIKRQLPPGERPAAIFCAVGGGGLLGGIMQGCTEVGWPDVNIVGCETVGSNCFHRTMVANSSFASEKGKIPLIPASLANGVTLQKEGSVKIASLDKLDSRAASLGATAPSARVVSTILKRGRVCCMSVPDPLSMEACALFAEEHKMLVELACGTVLVPAYNPALYHTILAYHPTLENDPETRRPLVFIVCGGAKISVKEIEEYDTIAEKEARSHQFAFIDRIKTEW
ncbi:tryptophan synthase beta subunit-like PLP-dependent enzyme [Dacryopinax primogenitus]|uniref:L-serine ammonia-lyase n=1 Tax=Dacryopinax primogenitus (strain DJM 731) TaxID=1858805 RepID=M5G331_DACPD|nr:tryptophan synthase beta subunit-like PLP-dependent enzyme [Dacryopinax primogenitus]EJU00257.1 tryptophan synthase beta subunit-like PLP-dependent enzyme [Dacryopinax primogenitus]